MGDKNTGRLGQNTVITVNTAAQSHAVNTERVRITSNVDCHIEHGTNPTAAVATSPFFPAGVEYFDNIPGEKWSMIKATAASAGVGSVTTVHP